MRLRILSPPAWRFTISITKWQSKLKIPLAPPERISNKLILVGNGAQDGVVYLILAHKYNGKYSIGITTTAETREGAISHIPTIIRELNIEKLVFSLDQESDELANLKILLEEKMKTYAITPNLREEQSRLYIYDCAHSQRQFELIVAVNGLDDPSYTQHTIEDHLLSFFKEMTNNNEILVETLNRVQGNPKEAWNLLRNHHEEVYQNLLQKGINELERFFPQQVESIKRLKSN